MSLLSIKTAFILFVVMGAACFSTQKWERRFENYSADVYAGEPALLNLASHLLARMYQTSIRERLQEEGSACQF